MGTFSWIAASKSKIGRITNLKRINYPIIWPNCAIGISAGFTNGTIFIRVKNVKTFKKSVTSLSPNYTKLV